MSVRRNEKLGNMTYDEWKKKKQRGENMGSNVSNVRLTDNTRLIKMLQTNK